MHFLKQGKEEKGMYNISQYFIGIVQVYVVSLSIPFGCGNTGTVGNSGYEITNERDSILSIDIQDDSIILEKTWILGDKYNAAPSNVVVAEDGSIWLETQAGYILECKKDGSVKKVSVALPEDGEQVIYLDSYEKGHLALIMRKSNGKRVVRYYNIGEEKVEGGISLDREPREILWLGEEDKFAYISDGQELILKKGEDESKIKGKYLQFLGIQKGRKGRFWAIRLNEEYEDELVEIDPRSGKAQRIETDYKYEAIGYSEKEVLYIMKSLKVKKTGTTIPAEIYEKKEAGRKLLLKGKVAFARVLENSLIVIWIDNEGQQRLGIIGMGKGG